MSKVCDHSNWLYFFGKRTLRLVKWCLDCDEEIRILNAKNSSNCDGICIQCHLSWSQCMAHFGEQETVLNVGESKEES